MWDILSPLQLYKSNKATLHKSRLRDPSCENRTDTSLSVSQLSLSSLFHSREVLLYTAISALKLKGTKDFEEKEKKKKSF